MELGTAALEVAKKIGEAAKKNIDIQQKIDKFGKSVDITKKITDEKTDNYLGNEITGKAIDKIKVSLSDSLNKYFEEKETIFNNNQENIATKSPDNFHKEVDIDNEKEYFSSNKSVENMKLEDSLNNYFENKELLTEPVKDSLDKQMEKESFYGKGCPIEGNGGHWDGERGNSNWNPNRSEIPKNLKTNPDGLSWGEILDKYGIDKISFKEGEPDFSEVSKGEVKIDNFTENRYGKGGNFDQASQKLAEQRGYRPEEVKAWMKDNKYTWHECSDCLTMQKVPTEVHGNIRHSGGISQFKNNN